MSNDAAERPRSEPALAKALRVALAEELVDFDPALAMRLRIARQRAFARDDERPLVHWPWRPAAVLAIGVAALALVVGQTRELSPASPAPPVALEAGATADDLAVSEDLEFYTWLASRDAPG